MRPVARVTVDGQDVTSAWSSVLGSLDITDEAGVNADTLEVELDNAEGFTAPPIGAEIRVWLGYEPTPKYMGRFKVDEWGKRGPDKALTLSAKSAELTTAIKAPKTRSHHDRTLGEIVDAVARDHGLTAMIDADLRARQVPHIDQQTESDLNLLSRLAKRNGATFKLADGRVIFTKKGSRKLPTGGDKPVIEVRPIDVADWNISCSKRGDYSEVRAGYMDHDKGKRVVVKAGGGGTVYRDKRLYASADEAQAAAAAQLGDFQRGQKTGSFSGEGNPELFAEALVRLAGFDPDCDGEYLIKTVRHSFSNQGYTSSVDFETEGASDAEADAAA